MRKNESPEILDMVFCHPTIRDKILSFSVGDDYGSHHCTVSVTIPLLNQPTTSNFSSKPNFKKADWNKWQDICDDLLPYPDEIPINSKLDIDILTKRITEAIEEADHKSIPRIKYKSFTNRLPPKIKHLLKVKRKLVKETSRQSIDINEKNDLIEEIKALNDIINKHTNSIIKEEWHKSCDQLNAIKDAKKYWSHFSKLIGTYKMKVYSDLKYKDQTAITDQERSEVFSQHLQNTFKTLQNTWKTLQNSDCIPPGGLEYRIGESVPSDFVPPGCLEYRIGECVPFLGA